MRRAAALILALLIPVTLSAQSTSAAQPNQAPWTTPSLTLTLADAPQPVSSAAVTTTGNPGHRTLYYWIVTNTTIGGSTPAGPFIVTMAPDSYHAGYVVNGNIVTPAAGAQLLWAPAANAISYDILRTATPNQPSGACNCATATGLTGTSYTDTSDTLSAYTVAPIDANAYTIKLTNNSTGHGTTTLEANGEPVGGQSLTCTGSGSAQVCSTPGSIDAKEVCIAGSCMNELPDCPAGTTPNLTNTGDWDCIAQAAPVGLVWNGRLDPSSEMTTQLIVQSGYSTGATITPANPITAGNYLLVWYASGGYQGGSAIRDSLGNTFVALQSAGGWMSEASYSALITSGGADTITFTTPGTNAFYMEVSGATGVDGGSTVNFSMPPWAYSETTVYNGDYLYTVAFDQLPGCFAGASVPTGTTQIANIDTGAGFPVLAYVQPVGSAGTYSETFGTSVGGNCAAAVITMAMKGLPFSPGQNGDWFINTTRNYLFGPKAADAWPTTGINLDPLPASATITACKGYASNASAGCSVSLDGTVTQWATGPALAGNAANNTGARTESCTWPIPFNTIYAATVTTRMATATTASNGMFKAVGAPTTTGQSVMLDILGDFGDDGTQMTPVCTGIGK